MEKFFEYEKPSKTLDLDIAKDKTPPKITKVLNNMKLVSCFFIVVSCGLIVTSTVISLFFSNNN